MNTDHATSGVHAVTTAEFSKPDKIATSLFGKANGIIARDKPCRKDPIGVICTNGLLGAYFVKWGANADSAAGPSSLRDMCAVHADGDGGEVQATEATQAKATGQRRAGTIDAVWSAMMNWNATIGNSGCRLERHVHRPSKDARCAGEADFAVVRPLPAVYSMPPLGPRDE